jgi:Ca2+-binding RTX toxin-like protein
LANLTVGAGKQFTTIAGAIAASRDGDVISVDAGTYTNDFATINTKITLQGVGGMVTMVATVAPPNGKAILTTNTDVSIDHFEFTGAAVPDMNGAGIRYQAGNLLVTNSYFHHNQEGILANASTGNITIRNSEFSHNGAGDGYSHNLYVGAINSLTIDNSYFHDAVVGHQIKSRALNTTITNSRIAEGPEGTGSYSIDLPNGGRAVLSNNVIQQGANSGNPVIVAFGEEGGVHAGSSLKMTGNTILNDLASSSSKLLWNATTTTAELTGNSVFGLSASQYASGPATVTNMTVLTTEPALDTSSPWATVQEPAASPSPSYLGDDNIILTAPSQSLAIDLLSGNDTLTLADGGNAGTVANVEQLLGGAGNDVITLLATPAGMLIDLKGGVNEIRLSDAGASLQLLNVQTVKGGTGADQVTLNTAWTAGSMDLGAGSDRLTLSSTGANTITVFNTEAVIGGSYADTVTLGTAVLNGTFDLGGGNDMLQLAAGTNSISTMNVELVRGNSGADTIMAEGLPSVRLEGWGGNDVLRGGAGNDVIFGGAGRDTMTGGAGADRFLFTSLSDSSANNNADVIRDFDASMDLIAFEGVAHNGFAWRGASSFVKNGVTQARFDEKAGLLSMDVDGNGRADFALTLTGVKLADLSASDFVWG